LINAIYFNNVDEMSLLLISQYRPYSNKDLDFIFVLEKHAIPFKTSAACFADYYSY
jgi:hypothetical protein